MEMNVNYMSILTVIAAILPHFKKVAVSRSNLSKPVADIPTFGGRLADANV